MPPDEGRLSSDDIRYLLAIAETVRISPDDTAAALARATAVHAAATYRHRGVPWSEIAVVYRITEEELRDWRATSTPIAHPPALSSATRPIAQPAARTWCFFAGNTEPNGNRFDQEAAQIRVSADSSGTRFEHFPCAEVHQIPESLDRCRPLVAHVAAHSHEGQIYLSTDGAPMPVVDRILRQAIRAAGFVPPLMLLNMCGSLGLAHTLNRDGYTTIGWPGSVDDGQCRLFADQLYRAIARGQQLSRAMNAATMMLIARNLRIAEPVLLGDGSLVLGR
jgi:hypothetical protein